MKASLVIEQMQMLILCPTGQDAHLISATLMQNDVLSEVLPDIQHLLARVGQNCGGIIIADEILDKQKIEALNRSIGCQEAWSDLPIIVLTSRIGQFSQAHAQMIEAFSASGNVTLLERPLRQVTLMSAVKVALRSRRRQYQVRELLLAQASATTMRDDFISIASHELKTPLTSLKLQAQMNRRMLDRGDGSFDIPKVSRFLDQTLTQLDRLNKLVDDMLDVTRISKGKLDVHKEKVDLTMLLRDVVERFAPQFRAHGCDLNLNIEDDIVGIWDPFKIEQVINNLFTNALKYAPRKPVTIELGRDSSYALLSVIDQGAGIPEENLGQIFERFVRVESKNSANGLGLGLFISRKIIDLHQGSIKVESEMGKGTKFAVSLPLGA